MCAKHSTNGHAAASRSTALLYIRKSLVKSTQSDPASPELQERECRARATQHGWVPELFTDVEGHNSGKTDRRDGWQSLRARLHDPDIAAVIVYAWNRAFRNTRRVLEFVDECDALGVRFISLSHNLDTRSADGRFVLTVLAAVDESESNRSSERRIETIAYLREHKGRHYGSVPFGAQRVRKDGDLVLVPSQLVQPNGSDHAALTRLYAVYAEGRIGGRKLASQLNDEGWRFRNRKGDLVPFTPEHVAGLLREHWIYAGYVTIGRGYRDQRQILKGSHNALLSDELTTFAAQALASHRRGLHYRARLDYPLTGLLTCICGTRMVGSTYRTTRSYRHVSACPLGQQWSITAHFPEDQVREHLAGLTFPHTVINDTAAWVENLRLEHSGTSPAAERARVQGALERLQELYVAGDVDRGHYQRRKAELLASMPAEPNPAPVYGHFNTLGNLAERCRSATPHELRIILNSIYERIEVRDRKVERYVAAEWAKGWAA